MIAWMLLLASSANAGELREPLLELLGAYEHGATHEDLARLGEGVSAELMAIATDDSVPHSRRGRAITALADFPGEPERAFLEARLAEPDLYLARKAVTALVRASGAEALPKLAPLLDHDDVQLRLATVRAVGRVDTAEARRLLGSRLEKEHNDTVRKALQTAIGGAP